MIFVIFYTIILLFIDRNAVTKQCLCALAQWYESMIPSLFPMMMISSIAVDTGYAVQLGTFCNKTLFRFMRLSDPGCFCLISGFLFGFPMGAKTTADMLKKQYISLEEAEFLLSFINCIGPMYVVNLIHTLFGQYALWKFMTGIYALPICYGIVLRYTLYRRYHFENKTTKYINKHNISNKISLLDALYECVPKCGKSILMLGGYMILFQISFIPLKHLLQSINLVTNKLYPLLELTGGLLQLPSKIPLSCILFYVTFGGACCLLQTYSFLHPAGLSTRKYMFHKIILGILVSLYGILVEIF